ncbi:MAG TPA: hypothetical protein PKA28_19940 [Methylomusa anaerophila]|uniref:hypothetical protein n=1 Tax=Methylomusa anaerophila TaxID=1930071 RepID=UPI0011AE7B1B|nr:hypothetical protein [Methylomusa anaerophila]HML90705.1 hypothetical protein [Methylomusa anaerophila]
MEFKKVYDFEGYQPVALFCDQKFKVIVSVNPNNFDKIKLPAVYSNPEILKEEAADEFVRMYYVACSRARESLYIHLPSGFDQNAINTSWKNRNVQYENNHLRREASSLAGQRLSLAFPYRFGVWFNKFPLLNRAFVRSSFLIVITRIYLFIAVRV